MWSDMRCIIWKEWREQFGSRGLRGAAGILLTLGVFGILLPLQMSRSSGVLSLLAWMWVPMFMVSSVIADAFAGERERHTLETLLATRLPDAAVLFGKMAAALGYAGGVTAGCVILGWITLTVVGRAHSGLSSLWPALAIAACAGLLIAVLVAALGTFISLRSSTVRQATQLLTGGVVIVLVGPVALVRMLPKGAMTMLLSNPQMLAVLPMIVLLLLVLVDGAALWLLVRRFRRSRLVSI